VFERFTQPAYRVVELANQEADRLRHGYLGPEHVLVGIVRQADSPAGRVLRARGLDLEAVRDELDRLVERGILPGPERNHAALLGSLGVDLEAVRRAAEEAFGQEAVGQATWRVSRRRWWRGGGPGWTPLCGKAAVAKRALQLASAEADALGQHDIGPEHVLLGLVRDAQEPIRRPGRYTKRVRASLGLLEQGPSPVKVVVETRGLSLEGLREAVLAELHATI
jgi:ATP-dependent Clp protease ATP-binding subunit ClpA